MASLPDFDALFQVMPSPYMVLDADLNYVAANDAYLAVTERTREELVGRHIFENFPNDDEGGDLLRASLARVFDTRRPDAIDIPYAIPRAEARGGGFEMRYWSLVHTPLLDEAGEVAFIAQSTLDVTHKVQADQQQKLLIDELNHRVKNTLATVQSIASQTLRTTRGLAKFRLAFEARLMALSATHDLLTASAWRGAGLRDVIAREFGPHGAERYRLDGPDVDLSPEEAVALGMLFHELTTNAAKYGALSTSEGCVRVTWSLEPEAGQNCLRITWIERDGPPVTAPARRGFGSRLIERSLKGGIGGGACLIFEPEGVTCRISLPLRGAT